MGRKICYSIILLGMSLFIFTPSIHAADGQTYQVGADNLNVREKPDHNAKVVGQLDSGDQVVAFQEKHGWVQTYYDGKKVWVASQFLMEGKKADKPANNDQVATAKTTGAHDKEAYQVDADILNVRAKPDLDAKVIGQLESGDKLVGFQEKDGWVQTFYDGKKAWVASEFLAKGKKPVKVEKKKPQVDSADATNTNEKQAYKVDADILNVRAKPDLDANIIGQLESGDNVVSFQEKNGWVQTYYDGEVAWVASEFLGTGEKTASTQVSTADKKTTTKKSNGSLDGFQIMIDPGHGGIDPGAKSVTGEWEKDLTLSLAQVVAQHLRDAGATVSMTRSGDTYIALEDRVQMSHANQVDAFISLHYNAFFSNETNGVSTHYYTNGADYELAQNIQSALVSHTDFRSRGVQQDAYHVLRKNQNLAVLVELGFITNPNDQSLIASENHPGSVASAITEGLIQHFE